MTRIALAAALVGAAFIATGSAAAPVTITQHGNDAYNAVLQAGAHTTRFSTTLTPAEAAAIQWATRGPTNPFAPDIGRIAQLGSYNGAATSQKGHADYAAIAQTGNHNRAILAQAGNGNLAFAMQTGNAFDARIAQTGDNDIAVSMQMQRNAGRFSR